MSDSWNVPSRKSNCSISITTEKTNTIFPLFHRIFFQFLPTSFSNVHISTAENGTIMITFSIHSVVSFLSPFTVSQMPQPPMTLLNGFIHRFRFNNVRNSIRLLTKANNHTLRKNTLSLNSLYHVTRFMGSDPNASNIVST